MSEWYGMSLSSSKCVRDFQMRLSNISNAVCMMNEMLAMDELMIRRLPISAYDNFNSSVTMSMRVDEFSRLGSSPK